MVIIRQFLKIVYNTHTNSTRAKETYTHKEEAGS